MAWLVVLGVMALGVIVAWREYRTRVRHAALHRSVCELHASLELSRAQLRRTAEDLYVIQTLMTERNLLDEGDLIRARLRLIEGPRRMAEERAAMARHLKISPTQLIADPGDTKIH